MGDYDYVATFHQKPRASFWPYYYLALNRTGFSPAKFCVVISKSEDYKSDFVEVDCRVFAVGDEPGMYADESFALDAAKSLMDDFALQLTAQPHCFELMSSESFEANELYEWKRANNRHCQRSFERRSAARDKNLPESQAATKHYNELFGGLEESW